MNIEEALKSLFTIIYGVISIRIFKENKNIYTDD